MLLSIEAVAVAVKAPVASTVPPLTAMVASASGTSTKARPEAISDVAVSVTFLAEIVGPLPPTEPMVMPDTAGSKHIDYRISMYQPMAYVKLHRHKTQEQVYHVIEGEGLMEIDGEKRVVRKHDFIFLPPGVDHSIENTGLVDLVFLVVTSPVTDA